MGAFKPDHAAIASLVEADFVQADLNERADRVVAAAKATARVDTGRYRDSIHTEDGPRGSVVVASDVEYAVFLELGTSKMPADHTISNALDAARD